MTAIADICRAQEIFNTWAWIDVTDICLYNVYDAVI